MTSLRNARFSPVGRLSTFMVSVLLLAAADAPAQGTSILFNNLGPGDTVDFDSNASVANYPLFNYIHLMAMPFVIPAGTNFTFDAVHVAVSDGDLTLSLALDNSGIPGAYLESLTRTLVDGANVYTFTSLLHPVMTAGDQYWIVGEVPWQTSVDWYFSPSGLSGPSYGKDGNAWTFEGMAPATKVEGTATTVPEPSTVVLAGMALLLGVCFLRQRKQTR